MVNGNLEEFIFRYVNPLFYSLPLLCISHIRVYNYFFIFRIFLVADIDQCVFAVVDKNKCVIMRSLGLYETI